MATAIRKPIGHDDRLSLVEHLDELRTRLIICVAALAVVFGLCAWQNGAILKIINVPLEDTANKKGAKSLDPFEQTGAFQQQVKKTALSQQRETTSASPRPPRTPPRPARGARPPSRSASSPPRSRSCRRASQ